MSPEERENLLNTAFEIRDVIDKKQKELELTFVEDTHTYFIKNKDGEIVSNFPSVSTVITQFYDPFDEFSKSLDMCDGHLGHQDLMLETWRATADYANNQGSRVHYYLEMDLLKIYKSDKEVRKPIFECDDEQIERGNKMIDAGHNFIALMHRRGAVLLDTEMVLGSNDLCYTGQPDKVWLMRNEKGELGFVITDWKTNKPKNFEVQGYTCQMLTPFEKYHDTALEHYKIQLPLYGRLILDMLKGSKFEDIKFFGCIIVHLLKEGKYIEFRVESDWVNTVLTMDPLPRIDEVLTYKKNQVIKEEIRLIELKKHIEVDG